MSIENGDIVLLIDNRNKRKLVLIGNKNKVKWRKAELKVNELVGKNYNSSYVLLNGNLEPASHDPFLYEDQSSDEEGADRNNKEILDNNNSQKLTMAEIEKLKTENPDAVVDSLVNNSSTFSLKNTFTQAKYKKKKEKKYIFKFRVMKPSLFEVAKTFFEEEPGAINFLSPEALALTIHYASKMKGGNTLVIDRCKGLVLYGISQRLSSPFRIFNLVDSVNQTYFVFEAFKKTLESENISNVSYSVREGLPDIENLVIAGELDPLFYVSSLYKKCATGAIITVQCKFLEPLIEINDFLSIQEPKCINISIHDIFSREIQVLKKRTHPMVDMNAFNGYILNAIKSD